MEKTRNSYTVYKHETPSGKIYIGITSLDPEKRWLRGRGYARNERFWNAIKRYGWENIKHEIVASGLSKEEASKEERRLIALYESHDQSKGYNLTFGGETGTIHTEESRHKLSESRKGQRYNIGVKFTEERKRHLREHHADFRGKKNPNFGKKWTSEEIAVRQSHRVYKTGADHPQARPILQLDKEENLIKRWGSISEAAEVFCKTSIKDCLRGKYKYHRGYIWRYENGNERDQIL